MQARFFLREAAKPVQSWLFRATHLAAVYLLESACDCDDALDSDPVDPEFAALPFELVEPELFALLEFEFVLSLEVWPEPELLEDEPLLPLAELELSDPEFVVLEFPPDSVVDEEPEAFCDEFCWAD